MESAAFTEHDRCEAAYALASGTQVRAEKTGLLFYQKSGPRLYYLSCGRLLDPEFFSSGLSVKEWLNGKEAPKGTIEALKRVLLTLETKGVVRACNGCT
jgi:putative mycofactocin binding protein MftB